MMLVFCLGILCGAAAPFPSDSVEAAVEAYEQGRYDEALQNFITAEKSLPENSSLAYNLALCRYRLGQVGHSLYNLRRCLRLDPSDSDARVLLSRLEHEMDLGSQIAPAMRIHPNLAFIVAVGFFNLVFVMIGLIGGGGPGLRGKGGWFILFIFVALLSVGGFGALIYAAVNRERPVAVVVAPQGTMKKIPLVQARPWMVLEEGTSLHVKGKAQDHVLVRTGLGLTGWIRSDEVRY